MKILLKILPVLILTMLGADLAMAQLTILPSTVFDLKDCKEIMMKYETNGMDKDFAGVNDYLGCAIKTGQVPLSLVPYFITYIANFLLSLGGIIAVLFIVIGGYNYIYGGMTEQKDKGKKTIVHALMGLVIGILSWVIVQVIITAVTS